jgi:transcriptional regulator with XRE-family HTH domain
MISEILSNKFQLKGDYINEACRNKLAVELANGELYLLPYWPLWEVLVLNTRRIYDDLTYVSKQCCAIRKKANMSQYDISEITGMGINTIYRIETGQRIPDLEQLFRYCYALDIPIIELFPPSIQNIGSTNQLTALNVAYIQLTEGNRELALRVVNALVDCLLSQQNGNL